MWWLFPTRHPAIWNITYNILYVSGLLVVTGSAITEAFEDFDQGPPGVANGSWRDAPLPPTPEPLGGNCVWEVERTKKDGSWDRWLQKIELKVLFRMFSLHITIM